MVEQYVPGRLRPEAAERFEDHYLSCTECQAAVERADLLKRGMKRMTAFLLLVVAIPFLHQGGSAGSVAGNVPVAYLQAERGGGDGEAPSYQARRPQDGGAIVAVLELDPPFYPSYRAALMRDTITLSLPSSVLAAGRFGLRILEP